MVSSVSEIFNEQIQPELIYFLSDLNWTFMIVYIIVLYGIKHTDHYEWYIDLFENKKKLGKFKSWLAGLMIGLVFCVFRLLGPKEFDSEYVAQFLRSLVLGITFSSLLVDWPIKLIEGRTSKN